MRNLIKIGVAFLATGLSSCDIVSDDVSPRIIEATAFTYAGKPAIINLASISDGQDLIATGVANPAFGTFQTILGGKYLVYSPRADFKGKNELVQLKLKNTSVNESFLDLNITFKSLDDGATACGGPSGIYDYAEIKSGESLEIDLLNNDIFCGVGYNGGLIGAVAVENINDDDFNLQLGPGRSAKFIFTPKPGFTGKVKVIYNLGINWIQDVGNVSSEKILTNPKKYLEAFTTAMVEVDVVSE